MSSFLVGLLVGGVIGVAATIHRPIMAKIVHSNSSDVPAKFVITCQADETGRADCEASDNERTLKMPIDPTGFPIGGPIVLTGVAYAVFSLLVGGEIVSGRVIEKSGWHQQCERTVFLAAKNNVPKLQSVPPKLSCKNAVGIFTDGYSSDADAFCGVVDLFLDQSPARQIENQNRKLVEAYNNRVAKAATSAGSRCACSSHMVQSDRVPWAIFSASWRTIKPPELGNLDAKLFAALNSPLCTGVGQ